MGAPIAPIGCTRLYLSYAVQYANDIANCSCFDVTAKTKSATKIHSSLYDWRQRVAARVCSGGFRP